MRTERCTSPASWRSTLQGRQAATVFHRWEWCELMTELGDVEFLPLWIDAAEGDAVLPVFCQRGRWTWSLIGYGGPVPRDGQRFPFAALEEAARRSGQRGPTERVELPLRSEVFERLDPRQGWGTRTTYHLPLPSDPDQLWPSYRGRARTSVRYARRHHVEPLVLGPDRLDECYRLYAATMARVGAAHVLPPGFFAKAHSRLGDGFLALGAQVADRLVAATVFLFDQRVAYHWIHATDRTGRDLQSGYVLLHEALRAAVTRGCRHVDLGAAPSPAVARHKDAWGARPVDHPFLQRRTEH